MLAGLYAIATPAAAATLTTQIAPWIAHATKIGTVDDRQPITLMLHLNLRNQDQLKSFVSSISKPGSASYGKYLTLEQFRATYAPAADDVQAVRDFLSNAGFKVTETAPSGIYVMAEGTVGQARAAFHVNEDYFHFKSRTVRANSIAPSLPDRLASVITAVKGLDEVADTKYVHTVRPFHGPLRAAPATSRAVTPTPPPVADNVPPAFCAATWNAASTTQLPANAPFAAKNGWANCGYTPQQVRSAYNAVKTQYDGEGVVVAIVDAYASPTMLADANAYAVNHDLPALSAINFRQTLPPGIYGANPADPCGPQGWWGEESLDVASVHGMAPGAKINFVAGANCGVGLDNALAHTIDTAAADIITNSYGDNGEDLPQSYMQAQDALFMEAAALGISVLFSSGDNGDLSQYNGVASGSWAADSAYVTAVGGTSLGLKADGSKVEFGWGNYFAQLAGVSISTDGSSITNTGNSGYQFYAGSGGGASLYEAQPDYQASVVPAALSGQTYSATGEPIYFSAPHRVSPDIALVADPFTGYLYGESFTIANTGHPVKDALLNYGCVPTTGTQEYCEGDIGGTSLASPLMAGVLARVNQARIAHSKPMVGFANPWLYGLKVGKLGNHADPLGDIVAPRVPQAVMYSVDGTPAATFIVSIDASVAPACTKASGICLGVDDVFNNTTLGFDNVTGLGVPDVGTLVRY